VTKKALHEASALPRVLPTNGKKALPINRSIFLPLSAGPEMISATGEKEKLVAQDTVGKTNGKFEQADKELSRVVPAALSVATGGVAIGSVFFGVPGGIVGGLAGAALGATAAHRRAESSRKTKN
jgi:hypothetical protein